VALAAGGSAVVPPGHRAAVATAATTTIPVDARRRWAAVCRRSWGAGWDGRGGQRPRGGERALERSQLSREDSSPPSNCIFFVLFPIRALTRHRHDEKVQLGSSLRAGPGPGGEASLVPKTLPRHLDFFHFYIQQFSYFLEIIT
jgi:hypothetical protein